MNMGRARYFKFAGAIILGVTAIFWFIKGLMDMLARIPGGDQNIFFSIALVFLIWLSWWKPLWGGVTTAVLAVILAVYFNLQLPNIFIAFIPLLLMCTPMVIGGLLFLEADWTSRKRD